MSTTQLISIGRGKIKGWFARGTECLLQSLQKFQHAFPRVKCFGKSENPVRAYDLIDFMAHEATGEEPVVRVFPTNHGRDMTLVYARIMRELTQQSEIDDGGERIIGFIDTKMGRRFIKGHLLDGEKVNRFIRKGYEKAA